MAAGVTVTEYDLAAYLPRGSSAIFGIIGPMAKGPTDQLTTFTDPGNFVNYHGRPVNNQYCMRAGIRYLKYGNQLKVVRIAGTLLSTAYAVQRKSISGTEVDFIRFDAKSSGTWGNTDIKVNITHNSTSSYNVWVYFRGVRVERFDNVTNSNVETTINNNSNYINATLHASAGTTFPDSTVNSTTGQLVPLVLAGGDDGAFASTRSDSSTGGIGAQNLWSYTIAASATTSYSGSEGRYIAPGTMTVADGTETFTDDGHGVLTGSVSGTGVVDYLTGEWSLTFAAAPTLATTVTYYAGTYEIIGSASDGTTNYEGTLSRYGSRPEYITIYMPREDQLDIGDGLTAAYSVTVGGPIVPGSISISTVSTANAAMTATDTDGDGNLSGDISSGTINYTSGAIAVTFTSNVKNLEPIMATFKTTAVDNGSGVLAGDKVAGTINYQTGAWTLVFTLTPTGDHVPGLENAGSFETVFRHTTVAEFGDASETAFTGTLNEYPIKIGSVVVVHGSGATLTDNGDGTLTGAGGSGTINYYTGAYTLTFTGAPALGFPIQIYYDSIVLHTTCKYCGDIGNERTTITDGFFCWLDKDPNTPTTNPADQWYRFRVMFNNGSGATAVETFNALTTVAKVVETVNDATNGSDYVTIEETGVTGELDVSYDSSLGQKLGMDGAFTMADVIGEHVGPSYTGLQLFSNPETVPVHFLSAPGMWHRQVQLAGQELSESEGRNAVWLFSIPDFENPYDARDFTNGEYNAATPGGVAVPTALIPYPPLATINSSHMFTIFPWTKYYDQYVDAEVWEPGEGQVAALLGRVERNFEAWFPIAGLRRGDLDDVVEIRYSPDKAQRAAISGLNGTRIEVVNSFVDFAGLGLYCYGHSTMAREATATDILSTRWTTNLIANALILKGRYLPFEINDEVLWREARSMVRGILEPIKRKRGIENYRVVCDATTNTADVIAARQFVCKVFIQFKQPAEEIEFQLIHTPLTTSFDEVAPLG
jgi:hypothetical protein